MQNTPTLFGPQSMIRRPQSITATKDLTRLAMTTLQNQLHVLECAATTGRDKDIHLAIHSLRGSLMVLDATDALATLNRLSWSDDVLEAIRSRDMTRLKADIAALLGELSTMSDISLTT